MKSILKGALIAMILLAGLSSHAQACAGSIIRTGTVWYPTGLDCITSDPGGIYVRMVFQTDENLVAYDINNKPHWASRTNGKPAGNLIFQTDGNWVMYWYFGGVPIVGWASNTAYNEYGGTPAQGAASWVDAQRQDGNVVLYDGGWVSRWDIFHNGYF